MSAVLLFVSSFAFVFLLGFQSQVVRDKERAMAFGVSLMIGLCELIVLKHAPSADFVDGIAFLLGGPVGIVSSIEAHDLYLKYKKRK